MSMAEMRSEGEFCAVGCATAGQVKIARAAKISGAFRIVARITFLLGDEWTRCVVAGAAVAQFAERSIFRAKLRDKDFCKAAGDLGFGSLREGGELQIPR